MNERRLGDRWAEVLRARECWVQKLPAGTIAGIPDWLVGEPGQGLRLVEAKAVLGHRELAYHRELSHLTLAQKFWLDQAARFGAAGLLLLDEHGYAELKWDEWGHGEHPIPHSVYKELRQPYG